MSAATNRAELHRFGVSAALRIDPDTKIDRHVFDALCLMNAGMAALDALNDLEEGERPGLSAAATCLLRQAHAVIKVAAGVPLDGGAT